jgi:hypothetical protein
MNAICHADRSNQMPLHELTSILCIALIITLTMIYWSAYKQAIAQSVATQQQRSDYAEQMKTQIEETKRHEKLLDESERQTIQHGKLLERQEMILARVETLVTLVEKSLKERKEE